MLLMYPAKVSGRLSTFYSKRLHAKCWFYLLQMLWQNSCANCEKLWQAMSAILSCSKAAISEHCPMLAINMKATSLAKQKARRKTCYGCEGAELSGHSCRRLLFSLSQFFLVQILINGKFQAKKKKKLKCRKENRETLYFVYSPISFFFFLLLETLKL